MAIIKLTNHIFFQLLIREATSAEAIFHLRPAHSIQYTHTYNNHMPELVRW